MPPEVWLPVPGYEATYEVSNHGRVRRIAPESGTVPGRLLQPIIGVKDYRIVSLSQDGDIRNRRLHRLVLLAFCGPEPFPEAIGCHNDGDKGNNALWNLRWASPADNQRDRIRHETDLRGSRVFGAKLTEADVAVIKERCRRGELNPSIADDYGVSISTIHLIRHNQTWRHVA